MRTIWVSGISIVTLGSDGRRLSDEQAVEENNEVERSDAEFLVLEAKY